MSKKLLSGIVSKYAKRMLEPVYDRLLHTRFGRYLKGLSLTKKHALEASMYVASELLEPKLRGNTPLEHFVKEVVADAAPEIAKRIINGPNPTEQKPQGERPMQQFYELVRELAGLGKEATEVAFEKARSALERYFSFLWRVSFYFGLFLAFTLVLFAFGAAYQFRAVISLATFLSGIAVFLWLVAVSPIVWAITKGLELESVQKVVELIGVVTLWIFFLSIYFYLVPVPLAGMPMVLLLTVAMAIASVIFGVGISTRFLAQRLGIMFVLMTFLLLFSAWLPSTAGGSKKLVLWIDGNMSAVMENVTNPVPKPVAYRRELSFFDPRTQKPLIWYFRDKGGEYEFFDAPGFHPQYGVKLELITPEIVAEVSAFFREKQRVAEKEQALHPKVIVAKPKEVKDTIAVTLKPGELLRIVVPPGFQVNWWGDANYKWTREGNDLIATLWPKPSRQETPIDYRIFPCTALMPCKDPIPNIR